MGYKFSGYKRLKLDNIKKEKMNAGVYLIFNKNKKLIYSGCSKILKHRLQAILYGRSDYVQIEGKMKIKNSAQYYKVLYITIKKAREIERNYKQWRKKK